MPKKLSDRDQVADPVRARLQAEQTSRVASLVGRAAAPAVAVSAPPRAVGETERSDPDPEEDQDEVQLQRQVVPAARAKTAASYGDHEHATVTRKTRFTPSEAEANEVTLALLRRLTDSRLSESAVTRVLWSLLREAETELKQIARKGVALRRPANGPSIEMAAYERDLGRLFLAALKSLGQ